GPRTRLRPAALARRAPARVAGRPEDVHARVAGPRAVVGRVVVARAALRGPRTAGRRGGEAVRRARARRPRAGLRHVALARRGPACEAGRPEGVHARVAGPQTGSAPGRVARAA